MIFFPLVRFRFVRFFMFCAWSGFHFGFMWFWFNLFFSFVFRYYLQQLHILRIVFQFFRCIYTSVHSLVTIALPICLYFNVCFISCIFFLFFCAREESSFSFCRAWFFAPFFFNINRDKSPQILTLNNQTKTKANPKCLLNQKRTYRSAKCTNIAIFIHKCTLNSTTAAAQRKANTAHRTHPNKQFATNFLMWLDF